MKCVPTVLAGAGNRATLSPFMSEPSGPERIGRVLKALAADLATEQRRVMRLRRENRELRAQVAALRMELGRTIEPAPESSTDPSSGRRRGRRASGESTRS